MQSGCAFAGREQAGTVDICDSASTSTPPIM